MVIIKSYEYDKTNDAEMDAIQEDVLHTADEEIVHEATTINCGDVSDDLATKLDETSSHVKPMSSLAEHDKNTKTGSYTMATHTS